MKFTDIFIRRPVLASVVSLLILVVGLRAIGACDTALWDIAAQAAGMPLHALLGSERAAIGAYASSQVLDSVAAYAQEAARYRADGWKAYKIHPPHGPDEDIKVCEAARKAVGDDYTLMLDSTWSYRYHDAIRVGRAIERLGFLWFDDPLNEEDIYSYYLRDAEPLCNAVVGFNFGDGHLHDWRLIQAIQKRCRFAPGELVVMWV